LESETVGAALATEPWQATSELLDHWIPLVRERVELRSKIDGYDEAKLLALDLDLLQQKWNKAQTTWFLPKMLNTGAVRKQLRLALPDKVKPDPLLMGEIVNAALRLREINHLLDSAKPAATTLLGHSWRNGEPQSEDLSRIRSWGETLHLRLNRLAGKHGDWLDAMRNLLAEWFKAGPASLKPGSEVGGLLQALRDAFPAFDTANQAFTEAASLDQQTIDNATDHFATVNQTLDAFLSSAPRLRQINAG